MNTYLLRDIAKALTLKLWGCQGATNLLYNYNTFSFFLIFGSIPTLRDAVDSKVKY